MKHNHYLPRLPRHAGIFYKGARFFATAPRSGEMYLEISVAPYTLQLNIDQRDHWSGIVVRMPDGVEAVCTYQAGLGSLLEGMCGRRWWQANRAEVTRQLALSGLAIE
jgi:hypothetical protein